MVQKGGMVRDHSLQKNLWMQGGMVHPYRAIETIPYKSTSNARCNGTRRGNGVILTGQWRPFPADDFWMVNNFCYNI